MSDDHSLDGEQEKVVQPNAEHQEELTRQQQQQQGWDRLADGHRDVIQTALKEPTTAHLEALKKLQVAEPKFARAVLKEYGYEDLDGYAKAVNVQSAPLAPKKEEVFKFMEEFEQEKTIKSTKAQIEDQFASLSEDIKAQAQKEFTELTEGRTLTPSQLIDFAKKSVTLANVSTGNSYRLNLSNLSSSSLSSVSTPPPDTSSYEEDLLEKAKYDPYAATILRGMKSKS